MDRTHDAACDRSWRGVRRVGVCLLASALVVLGVMASPSLGAPIMPPAPDHGWLFDDGAGSTATALHGAVDATLAGGAGWSTDVPVALGYAGNHSLLLDGAGDQAEAASLAGVLDGASGYALSAWIRSDVTGQDRAFFSGADPSNNDTFGARHDANGWLPGNTGTSQLLKFSIGVGGSNYQYESSGGVQTTAWQHILFTWESGAGARLYVNGVLDTPSAISSGFDSVTGVLSGQNRFLIGNGPKNHWQGRIDEVMVWRQGLDADQAEWLAANSMAVGPTPIPEPGTGLLLGLGIALLAARRAAQPRA